MTIQKNNGRPVAAPKDKLIFYVIAGASIARPTLDNELFE